ncbi:septal ring lytic transglycosylase RlpA family protein [Thermoflexibacter ruber]|uniref:Probable endolytic peptidoglycan transglycosylase RlpA n=1 Tax=Thermoflexibacter ruber TaxID=1003 RepID=A0A1I2GH25_9BACT|nr:septal ring lytic transglycosylase RlpA family protein [Thermoflexibacter ruber]SFF16905.1 Sporulation related domain-containing protein [Thermoflexibacter ruber]
MKSLYLSLCSVLLGLSILSSASMAQEITQIGYTQIGKASYYSDDRNGAITQSGEKYDPNVLEAAHARIAFNSLVKITNLENGKQTIVRINDRPLIGKDRIIDMTRAAADALGMTDKKTVIEVKIELIQLGVPRNNAKEIVADAYRRVATKPIEDAEEITKEEEISAKYEGGAKNKTSESENKNTSTVANNKNEKNKVADSKKKTVENPKGVLSGTSNPNTKSRNKDKVNFEPVNTYTSEGDKVKLDGFGVQVASYDDINKALKEVPNIEKLKMGQVYIQAGWANGKKMYRILVGNFKTKEIAQKTSDKINKYNYKSFPKKHFD